MGQKNGYLRIAVKDGMAYCHLFLPQDGGLPVTVHEADDYLSREGFSSYDKLKLKEMISSGTAGNLILGPCRYPTLSESMVVTLAPDLMTATARFYPPSVGGSRLNKNDILAGLKAESVKFGIDEEKIDAFINSPVYCTDVVLAEGKPVRAGHDAAIEYFFNTNPTLRPKLREDGSVDFHDLSIINAVQKGDLLARLHPCDRGDAGQDVTGKTIAPPAVRNARLEFGRDITENAERTEIRSAVDGHVSYVNGKVFVSATYEIPADVDNSTGNINFSGNVHVRGSVRSGFSITCDGDIEVDGVVENAHLTAGGQIIVKHGLHGMGRGLLEAGGNVISKFVENGKVTAGGYVESGSIINSEVSASGDVHAEDHKGFISGGVIRAGGSVTANTIGSRMESPTRIEVGTDPETKSRYKELSEQIRAAGETVKKVTPVLTTYKGYLAAGKKLDEKNVQYLMSLASSLEEANKTIEDGQGELENLKKQMEAGSRARISVERDIYPGVTVVMGSIQKTLKKKLSHCYLSVVDGEISQTVT